MNDKKTITTIEQIKTDDGIVKQRIATHISAGAHGYSTLCTDGYNRREDKKGETIVDCKLIAENQLPVTCATCYILWHDANFFTENDFNINDEKSNFVNTDLINIKLPNEVTELLFNLMNENDLSAVSKSILINVTQGDMNTKTLRDIYLRLKNYNGNNEEEKKQATILAEKLELYINSSDPSYT